MNQEKSGIYAFDSFRVDARERQLSRNRQPLPLPPKVFDVLLVLVENNGRIVGKDELMKKVWSDTFVEEANLTVNISALRKVLNEDSHRPQFIETIPKRGYRFIAPVTNVSDEVVHSSEIKQILAETNTTPPVRRSDTQRSGNVVALAEWRHDETISAGDQGENDIEKAGVSSVEKGAVQRALLSRSLDQINQNKRLAY